MLIELLMFYLNLIVLVLFLIRSQFLDKAKVSDSLNKKNRAIAIQLKEQFHQCSHETSKVVCGVANKVDPRHIMIVDRQKQEDISKIEAELEQRIA